MPGIILDPRQNSKEERYGIIKIFGFYVYYDKKDPDNDRRFMPFGWKINKKTATFNDEGPTINWNGIDVKLEVNFENATNQGPVTMKTFEYLRSNRHNKDVWPNDDAFAD